MRAAAAARTPEPTRTPTRTSTPIPTPTAPITLQAEDSVSPVTCHGGPKPLAPGPFLSPPYRGWTSLVSYFDHDSPNFLRDGQIITATGAGARADAAHQATDFPAYWSSHVRQYLYYDGHNGYDYNISYQPVYAAAPGKVIYAALEYAYAPDHGYGNMVMISHAHGYVTLYGHFSKILVHQGQRVRRGQRIGTSGNTGHSTGPHLHFTVFHNCIPTDPYGWTGGGQDPLAGYGGESSMYLWLHPPLITNPSRGWPGIDELPTDADTRYLLLRLPSTLRGTSAFTRSLKGNLALVRRRLTVLGVPASADALLGAIRIDGAIPASRLYALPDVVSVGSPDVVEAARLDVLQALGRAALVTPHRRLPLNRSHSWSGFLYQWQGRTFLLGSGEKGKAVSLRLHHVGRRDAARTVQADAATGSYAVDLGKLSAPQIHAVARELRGAPHHKVASPTHTVGRGAVVKPRPRARVERSPGHPFAAGVVALAGLLALLAALLTVPTSRTWVRRRLPLPGDHHPAGG